eukprot:gnl/TRDRNA2_/TRDRNA2_108716_c0_seq2.p1 gnl/TRDRNA2_/TRDRNA2_108716_c0~~gnl/TRDRNA2_/TRDRNA2_108716_c0_seq2.p1  ORF type:complete len:997 (+),score=181.62 gnl/TRDRNA2_/TRDRNA2_108716_c0_seq2:172-3162(+)
MVSRKRMPNAPAILSAFVCLLNFVISYARVDVGHGRMSTISHLHTSGTVDLRGSARISGRGSSTDVVVTLDNATKPATTAQEQTQTAMIHLGKNEPLDAEGQHKEAMSTWDKMQDAPENFPRTVRADYLRFRANFLPRWYFKDHIFWSVIITTTLTIAWFISYMLLFYHDDRSESLERWKVQLEEVPALQAELEDDNCHVKPDMILVFQHPCYEYGDEKTEVQFNSINRVFVHPEERHKWFPRVEHETKKCSSMSTVEQAGAQTAALMSRLSYSDHDEGRDKATKLSVRCAIIHDLYRVLPKWGFDVHIFSSIDDDELYVCIKLEREEVIEYMLRKTNTAIPVKPEVIPKLGIAVPNDHHAASPPHIRFDARIVSRLHQAGVLCKEDHRELFVTHHTHGRAHNTAVVSGLERIRFIFREVSSHFDCDAAKEEGLMLDWYPVHHTQNLAKLRATWASWNRLRDMSFVQPIPFINTYFGSRVAFSFAWNGLYCKALLCILPVALVSMLLGPLTRTFYDASKINSRQVLGFSIVLVIWGRLMANFWEREQEFFIRLWDMDPHDDSSIMRPQYKGTLEPSEVDANLQEKRYPQQKFILRCAFSGFVTLLFCLLVLFLVITWMTLFMNGGRMSIMASIFLSIQIKVFEFIYNYLCVWLTDFENHKFNSAHYNSYLWKQFGFQFVNNYSAFFFLALKQPETEGECPNNDCLSLLRLQLSFCVLVLAICRVGTVIFSALWVKFMLWFELYQLRKQGIEPPSRCFAEEQSKYTEFRIREQIESMLTLVISLGFVFLFGTVAPIVVPLSFFVFWVQLRANAYLVTMATKRTVPRKQVGIGAWQDVMELLMKFGILFSGFLIVAYGDTFKGTPLIAKLTGLVLFCMSMGIVWFLCDLIVPYHDPEAKLLLRRRNHMARKLMHMGEQAPPKPGDHRHTTEEMALETIVDERRWNDIPHADGTIQEKKKPDDSAEQDPPQDEVNVDEEIPENTEGTAQTLAEEEADDA